MWIVSLISALLGALVGGLATYYFNNKHAAKQEDTQRRNLAKALRVELLSLQKRYMPFIGNELEKEDKENLPLLIGFLDNNQNFFIVFDNSSNLLGLLDSKIASKVIETYINTKAFYEELIHNGKMLQRLIDAKLEYGEHSDQHQIVFHKMKVYRPYLRTRHYEVKKLIEETTTLLEEIN